MLYLDVQQGECLKIGDLRITLVRKAGKRARLALDIDPSVKITQYVADKPDEKYLTSRDKRLL